MEIRISESIFILRSPEAVWDYTQDFSRRTEWDDFILHAAVLQENPKTVRIKGKGNFSATFIYKLNERPHKTSLAFTDVKSPMITGGGGSWRYESENGGTRWTQMGTCILKDNLWFKILIPFIRYQLHRSMRKSMKKAKKILEKTN